MKFRLIEAEKAEHAISRLTYGARPGDVDAVAAMGLQTWIDQTLDHKMILRHDDPLVKALETLGEPMFLLDSNPTVERIARLIFDTSREHGLPVMRVTVWETPSSWATYQG